MELLLAVSSVDVPRQTYLLVAVTGDALGAGANWFAGYPEMEYWLGWSIRMAERFGSCCW